MNRYFLIAVIACLSSTSTAVAQRDFFQQLGNEFEQQGRQMLRQEFGVQIPNRRQQGGGNQIQSNSSSLPSEAGNRSGGQGRIFTPDNGYGFGLPGNGGGFQRVQNFDPNQNFRPGQPYQPTQPNYYGNNQPTYPGNQTFHYNQSGQIINGGSVVSSGPHSSSDIPSSPVMTDQYVMIRCPKTTSGSISYTLTSSRGNFGFTLSAGQEQRFRFGEGWSISYNDGSQQRRYRLEGGKTYSMSQSSTNVWQLFAAK